MKVAPQTPTSPTDAARTEQEHVPVPAPAPVPLTRNEQEQPASSQERIYAPIPYMGDATLQERISVADVIAHVRLLSVEATAERFEPKAARGETSPTQPYAGVLKFTFAVQEYLKSGANPPNRIRALVGSLDRQDTETGALALANRLLTGRDARWDSHEAVVFLASESGEYPATASDDLYFMSLWDFTYGLGDMYSIASTRNKIWLPSTTPGNAQVAGELRFYLEEPSAGQSAASTRQAQQWDTSQSAPTTAQTIGLSEIRNAITAVDDMIVDGSRKHELCVISKLNREREWGYMRSIGNEPKTDVERIFAKNATILSGQPAGTVVFDRSTNSKVVDGEEEWHGRAWLEGEGAELFAKGEVTETTDRPTSISNSFSAFGGRFLVTYQYLNRPWETVRPLPQGIYNLRWKSLHAVGVPCNDTDSIWDFATTITVTAPDGALHEALFDPVTDGAAVAADSSNGQLEPAGFTDANGASATLQRIEWAAPAAGSGQAGTVKVKVSPHTGLAGHRLDFIELDGEVSLSLLVDEATVDPSTGSGQAGTLSWFVTEQPWHDGDLLMVRIKEIRPEVALVNVPATITQGQSVTVTLHATGLSSGNSYSIRLSTDNDAIAFGDSCLISSTTLTVPSGNPSHSRALTLHGCTATAATVMAVLLQGNETIASATAEVQVEEAPYVTLTLSPREERRVTFTDMTIEWNDPNACTGRYLVALYNSSEVIYRNFGFHPAPATTSISPDPQLLWDTVPSFDGFVRVSCYNSGGEGTTVVGQASLQSGLPSESGSY